MADSKNLDFLKQLNEMQDELNKRMSNTLDINERIKIQEEYIANQKRIQVEQDRLVTESKNNNIKLTTTEKRELDNIVKNQKAVNTELSKEEKLRQRNLKLAREFNNQLKLGWQYLMQSDKVLRQTILNLGLSGAKAELMRTSFENSAQVVAHMGGTLADVQTIMQGYADETGRARVLSAQMVQDIMAIGKGTGLGVEQATKLGAQFEYMGFDAKSTMEYVQGVVDTSERMGVNTTKVLRNISDNFKKLSTFTFQAGVKGFAEMAEYAEKTRVSMATALDVAEATRNLDKVIELGANLQVMGGRFAEMDPFQWLYTVRNEPEKLNEQISKMTEGIYTLRKSSDGTFEKFISPADRDRLTNVAKSLGIAQEEMFEIAQRRLDISLMDKQLAGTGLTKRQKELIEGAAIFNKTTGKFQAELGGVMRDISEMTQTQASAFEKEQSSLKDRAVAAQDFETAYRATIEEFKTILLPMLKGINSVLTTVRPIFTGLAKILDNIMKTDIGNVILKGAGILMSAGFLINKAVTKLTGSGLIDLFRGGGIRGVAKGAGSLTPATTGSISGLAEQRKGIGAGAAAKGAGMKALGTGAGIGAAAAGVGGGILLAAKGISELAQGIKDVDVEKLKVMNTTVIALGGTFAAILIPAMFALGAAGPFAALGLAAVGAAAVGIGFGVNLAAKGIGVMAEGLGNLVNSAKGSGKDMLMIAGGIAGIAGSLALFSNPLSALGIGAFAGVMAAVAVGAGATALVANSIAKMGISMKGSKEDWLAVQNAVESISKGNVKGGSIFSDLATLLKSPLKVEFADKQVAMVNDITLNIDGEKFMQRTYRVPAVIERHERARTGKAGA